jgi:hypothetical protein
MGKKLPPSAHHVKFRISDHNGVAVCHLLVAQKLDVGCELLYDCD